jgi:hypothetical protein
MGGCKHLQLDSGICRHISRDGCDLLVALTDSVGDSEAFCVTPGDLPYLLRRAPYGAEALGALAKLGLRPRDAHVHDLVVTPPEMARARTPGDGLDDKLDGLQAAAVGFVVEVAHAD